MNTTYTKTWLKRVAVFAACLLFSVVLFMPHSVMAQSITLDMGGEGDGSVAGRVIQTVMLITILSLAPSIIIMMTSFTRIVVVLSFLRTAIGTQQSPPNTVLISLAMFLTFFIMAPTIQESYDTGIKPLMEGKMEEMKSMEIAVQPFKKFMLAHAREKDLQLFINLGKVNMDDAKDSMDTPLKVVIPAFMISELRRAFEIGFLIFLPFLIIDLVTASILMSMGMMMLPPSMIAMPFKIVFFVMVDGWYLMAGSLMKSYGLGGG